jgi:hypothetical protein
VPPILLSERWALTPPFHPYRQALANRRCLAGLPARYHRAAQAGGLSFCGTVRERWHRLQCVFVLRRATHIAHAKPHALKSMPPFPWRYQARCPLPGGPRSEPQGVPDHPRPERRALLRWCPDFPPARVCRRVTPPKAQASDHPAHPPPVLYRELRNTCDSDEPDNTTDAIEPTYRQDENEIPLRRKQSWRGSDPGVPGVADFRGRRAIAIFHVFQRVRHCQAVEKFEVLVTQLPRDAQANRCAMIGR